MNIREEVKKTVNSKYGLKLSDGLKVKLKEVYHSGNSQMVYVDTDSAIVSKDNTFCFYDHAKELSR